MNTYLVAHYNSSTPAFSYTNTLADARASVLSLLKSQDCKKDDILSVVDVSSDSIVYYGKRDELLAKFNAVSQPKTTASLWSLSFKPVLNWINLKVARPSVG